MIKFRFHSHLAFLGLKTLIVGCAEGGIAVGNSWRRVGVLGAASIIVSDIILEIELLRDALDSMLDHSSGSDGEMRTVLVDV